jgi:hypothetical protein
MLANDMQQPEEALFFSLLSKVSVMTCYALMRN